MIHHDIWDYDSTNATILFDLNGQEGHRPRRQDRVGVRRSTVRTGKPIHRDHREAGAAARSARTPIRRSRIVKGDTFAKVCSGLGDREGTKAAGQDGVARVGCIFEPYDDKGYTVTMPGALGGANWPPSAYSPETGYMYICSKDSYGTFKSVPAQKQKLATLGDFGTARGRSRSHGRQREDRRPARGDEHAQQPHRLAGEVAERAVLQRCRRHGRQPRLRRSQRRATSRRTTRATGSELWRSPKLKAGVNAAPVTYTANGKQYVAVYAGGNGITGLVGASPPRCQPLHVALPG